MRIFLLAAILCIFTSCEKKQAISPPPPVVTTITVHPQNIPAAVEFVGVAESSHLVEIRSRVEGYLWKINYQEGSFVDQGDLLFEIDPRQFIAAVDEAKGELARQKAILWAAEQAVARYTPLYEQKAASKKDLDDATAHMLASQASVETAQAHLVKAQLDLGYASIVSPISGLTGRAKYREGTLITPSINGLLTTVAVIDPIWVIFSVADYYLLSTREEVKQGRLIFPPSNVDLDVSLTLSNGLTFPHLGKVNFASPTLDQNTGTMTVRAVFPNPEKILRPGQFVRATVSGATRPNAIIVPQEAVQQGAQGMYVYIVNQDKEVQLRYVEAGNWYKNSWIIKSGLQANETVIVQGVNKVMPGMKVSIKNAQTQNKTS